MTIRSCSHELCRIGARPELLSDPHDDAQQQHEHHGDGRSSPARYREPLLAHSRTLAPTHFYYRLSHYRPTVASLQFFLRFSHLLRALRVIVGGELYFIVHTGVDCLTMNHNKRYYKHIRPTKIFVSRRSKITLVSNFRENFLSLSIKSHSHINLLSTQ